MVTTWSQGQLLDVKYQELNGNQPVVELLELKGKHAMLKKFSGNLLFVKFVHISLLIGEND